MMTETIMEHEQMAKQIQSGVARQSARIYLPISLGTALLFLLASSLWGDYPLVAKIGGSVWVGILSLIISMPVVTARVKKAMARPALALSEPRKPLA